MNKSTSNILNDILQSQNVFIEMLEDIDIYVDDLDLKGVYIYLLTLNDIMYSINSLKEIIPLDKISTVVDNQNKILDILIDFKNDINSGIAFNPILVKVNALIAKLITFKNTGDIVENEEIQLNQWVIDNLDLPIPLMREKLLNSHSEFCRFMFCEIEGKYIPTKFDNIFNATIDKIFTGEIKRLIINIPVGMGKTGRGVIAVVARGFAIEPRSKFINISYDTTLVQLNSSTIRDFCTTKNYMDIFKNVEIKKDTKAKGLWKTTAGGAIRAVSSGSGITGFRAGNIAVNGFSGAMIIDDPLKPDDTKSIVKMEYINNRYENTFKSRLAHEDIPIIVIMQRLDKDDFTNHLLTRYGNEYKQLIIPAYVNSSIQELPRDNIIEHGLDRGAIWSDKYSQDVLMREKMINPLYFYSQLQQEPSLAKDSTNPLQGKWLLNMEYGDELTTEYEQLVIVCDTAMKTKETSDYSVFLAVALTKKGTLHILDMWRDKVEIPQLEPEFEKFYKKWKYYGISNCDCLPMLNCAYIEDKSSGTGLIQGLRRKGYNIVDVQRNTDKLFRVNNVVHFLYQGLVYLQHAQWATDVRREFDEFTNNDRHPHDDIIDCIVDSIEQLIVPRLRSVNYNSNNLTNKLPI